VRRIKPGIWGKMTMKKLTLYVCLVCAASLAFTGCGKQSGGKLRSMETIKTLAMRKAIRNYRSEQISGAELNRALCAASLAPVGLAAFENYCSEKDYEPQRNASPS
jgi:hypothetical protein